MPQNRPRLSKKEKTIRYSNSPSNQRFMRELATQLRNDVFDKTSKAVLQPFVRSDLIRMYQHGSIWGPLKNYKNKYWM